MRLIKGRDFNLLFAAKFLSITGSMMQDFALGLYILEITHSGTMFASIMAVALIPQILIGPFGGILVDWLNRKKMLIILDLLSGVILFYFILIFSAKNEFQLSELYIVVILLSIITSIYSPLSSTIIPSIVEKGKLVDANSLNSLCSTIANLISPIIGAILYSQFGLLIVLIINSGSFIIAGILEIFIRIPKTIPNGEQYTVKRFFADFKEGLIFIKDKKVLLNLSISALVINCVFSPIFSIGLIYISKMVLKVSNLQYSLVQVSIVAGMILSPFTAGIVLKKLSLNKLFYMTIIISSICIFLMSLTISNVFCTLFNSNLIPFALFSTFGFIIGGIVTLNNISCATLEQNIIPLNLMGRVNAVTGTLVTSAIPIGQIIYGRLFDSLVSSTVLIISGVLMLLVGVNYRRVAYYDEKLKVKPEFVNQHET